AAAAGCFQVSEARRRSKPDAHARALSHRRVRRMDSSAAERTSRRSGFSRDSVAGKPGRG
ncbi:hypothetical protein, partial [Pantoea dispersa]|uniref:hypothetical protein n=1 Tax=Pantoea dispersa TaxID=59814 RepID=UPI001C65D06C